MNDAAIAEVCEAALAAAFEKPEDAVDVVLLALGPQDGATGGVRAL